MDKSLFEAAATWLDNINLSTFSGWLKVAIIIGLFAWGVLFLFKYGIEVCAKLVEFWKNAGLPTSFSRTRKLQVRRRQQLCQRLQSDLRALDKSEHWNDQLFTDLEAEVEAEGRYYDSWWSRQFKRPATGLRRARSLIKAIDLSAERTLLVVGEPGSGKSVAFRHLAIQLTERGRRSSSSRVAVPLYINLKELPPAPAGTVPDADFISRFVLEHIRRGDADLAESIQEYWQDYRDRGLWFFLFDSFDEIPAVMHAPSGSPVVQQHGEAIRKFLDGMGQCRGCLASREFKGPEQLPWVKFRILLLSPERQEELIQNSLLDAAGQQVVRKHLAAQPAAHLHTPLFLTLMCRYVRRTGAPPANDYNLLENHIDLLANRDPDYLLRRYGLTPNELLAGAQQLAVLFAQDASLSLAPTVDAIAAAWPAEHALTAKLDTLLNALVYVKIGRSDVPQASRGDQPFTFAHRRYQETLFVRFLAQNPAHLPPAELLTDRRWREYAVTLLQTQPLATLQPLLEEATRQLTTHAANQQPTPILPEFGGHLGYYEWEEDGPLYLLRALQEGLGRRLTDVPAELAQAVEAVLGPRWNGDWHDRERVLEVGALLPQPVLSERLSFAVLDGTEGMERAAFQQIVSLHVVPSELAHWARERIGEEVLRARKRVDLLKMDALCSRLSSSVRATLVFNRATKLRALVYLNPLDALLRVINETQSKLTGTAGRTALVSSVFLGILSLLTIGVMALFLGVDDLIVAGELTAGNSLVLISGVTVFVVTLRLCAIWLCLDTGELINTRVLRAQLVRKSVRQSPWVAMFGAVLVAAALITWEGQRLGWEIGFALGLFLIFYGILLTMLIALLIILIICILNYNRRLNKIVKSLQPLNVILCASSHAEAVFWLRAGVRMLLPTEAHIRSLGRLFAAPPLQGQEAVHPEPIRSAPLLQDKSPSSWRLQSALSQELDKRRAEAAKT